MKTLRLVARPRRHSRAEQEVDEVVVQPGSRSALSSVGSEDPVQQCRCSDQFPPIAPSIMITILGNPSTKRMQDGDEQWGDEYSIYFDSSFSIRPRYRSTNYDECCICFGRAGEQSGGFHGVWNRRGDNTGYRHGPSGPAWVKRGHRSSSRSKQHNRFGCRRGTRQVRKKKTFPPSLLSLLPFVFLLLP